MKNNFIFFCACLFIMTSCNMSSNKTKYNPNEIDGNSESVINHGFDVGYKLTESNIKTIHVKLNGSSGVDAIFDTGCSGMVISTLECLNLAKAGKISDADVVGSTIATIADGTQMENALVNLREVTIVDKNGKEHTAIDVKVQVVENPEASVLIGNTVIDQWAKTGFTMDFNKNIIRFH